MISIHNINRYQASGSHLFLSACIAATLSVGVYFLWYPGELAYASGISAIFLLLIGIDVVLGPVLTLIVFNPKKKSLKFDLSLIVFVQIAALIYGMHTILIARPVYMVFNVDRLDVVYANDITDEALAKATRSEFKSLPYFGPKTIAATLPSDSALAMEISINALSTGTDIQHLPERYTSYSSQKDKIKAKIKPLNELSDRNSEEDIQMLIERYSDIEQDVGFLPLLAKEQYVAIVLDKDTTDILEITRLRP